MNNKTVFIFLIIACTFFEILGDVLIKKWALANKNYYLAIGFALYSTGTIFWAVSLKYELLTKAISIITILNLIVVALIGMLLLRENISLINKLGLILGVAGIILIEL